MNSLFIKHRRKALRDDTVLLYMLVLQIMQIKLFYANYAN